MVVVLLIAMVVNFLITHVVVLAGGEPFVAPEGWHYHLLRCCPLGSTSISLVFMRGQIVCLLDTKVLLPQ